MKKLALTIEATRLIQSDIARLDAAVADAERVWGRGRLEHLVPVALATRVREQRGKIYDALEVADPALVEAQINSLIAGYAAMARVAEKAGAAKLDRRRLEAVLPDGTVLAVIPSGADHGLRDPNDPRERVEVDMDSLALLWASMQSSSAAAVAGEVLKQFPGTKVSAARINWELGDEIPF